jgi:hypothetical protein
LSATWSLRKCRLAASGRAAIRTRQIKILLVRLFDETFGVLAIFVRAPPLGVVCSPVSQQLSLLAEPIAQPSRSAQLHRWTDTRLTAEPSRFPT